MSFAENVMDPTLKDVNFDSPDESGAGKRKSKKRKDNSSGFRKAPQAPKRFKSPYILFSMSKMEEFKKEEGSSEKVTSISRRVAEAWRNLPAEERKKWDEVAKQDKLRYNAEKTLYTGPWQVPSKRTRKDPSAPKRPMSAFLFFSQGMRQKLKAENPNLKNTEISCLLGERWKIATEGERRPHIEREEREREIYKKKIAEWRAKKEKEDKAMRKRRQEIAEQFVKSGFYQQGYNVQLAQPNQASTVAYSNGTMPSTPGTLAPSQQYTVAPPVYTHQYGGEIPQSAEAPMPPEEHRPSPMQDAPAPYGDTIVVQVPPHDQNDYPNHMYQYVQIPAVFDVTHDINQVTIPQDTQPFQLQQEPQAFTSA